MIYNRFFDIKVNEQVFGGIITALDVYASNLIEGGLTNFEMSTSKITLLKVKDFIFVVSSPKKSKDIRVENELKIISERFFNKYSKSLENSVLDPRIFSNFDKEIGDLLHEHIEKFWEGF